LASSNKNGVIRVLHVDDDSSAVEISKQIMMEMDCSFEFDSASCVDEALNKLSTGQYDVVISDYEMPQKNGLEFLTELRGQNNHIPFILFTGKGREEVAIRALNLGADGYYNKQGNPETVYGELAHGIRINVKRKKAEELLRKNEEQLEAIISHAPIGIAWSDSNKFFLGANKPFSEMLGFSEEELRKLTFKDITHPDDINESISKMEELTSGRISFFSQEKRYIRKDGTVINGKVTVSEIRNKEGKPALFIVELEDISKSKKAEKSREESEEKFKKLAEESPNMIFINRRGRVVYANKKCEEITGYSREEFYSPNFNFLSLNPPEYVESIKLAYTKHLRGETVLPYEYVLIARNGERINALINTSLIEYDGDKAVLGIVTDITEHKRMEEALKESEGKLRSIVENSSDRIVMFDRDYRFLFQNKAAADLFGMSPKEMIGVSIFEVFPETIAAQFSENIKKAFDTGNTVLADEKMVVKDLEFYNSTSLNPVKDESGKVIAVTGIVRDITERKKAEEALSFSEQRWATTLSSVGDGVIATDVLGKITFMNRAAEELTGWSLQEASKKPSTDFFKIFNEQSRLEAENPVAKVLKSGQIAEVANYTSLLQKDGSEIPIDDSAAPIKDKNGNITGVVLVFRDRTERKKAEEKLKATKAQIEMMNEKLRVVGGLTRHDVRNKLSAVNGYTYLLKKKHADQADIVDGLGKIELAVKDSVKIFEFAKMYEQLGVEELTFVDVGKALDEAVALFSGLTIKVVNDCHGSSVMADSFLRQMFYNLIDNTLKHGVKATAIKVYYEKEESGGLLLIYEDNGVGISEENKSKLFNEGFSTGGSTGFGLFFIKKMMSVYGWVITEEGELGKGAKFIITIPHSQIVNDNHNT